MVFPPFPLQSEVENTIDSAEDGQPATDAEGRLQSPRKAEYTERDETAPDLPAEDMPADGPPHGDTPHPAVEREQVAGENGHEGSGAPPPREPAHDEDGHGQAGRAPEGEGAGHGRAARAERYHGRTAYPEERSVGLEHDAGTRGQAAPHHRCAGAARLPDAGRAPGREHEKGGEEKIALAGPPCSPREVIEDEEQSRGETAPLVSHAPREAEKRGGGEGEPPEIEEPPRPIALAQRGDD